MTTPNEDRLDQYRLKRIHQRPYWVMLILLALIVYTLWLARNTAIDLSRFCRGTVTEENQHYCSNYWSEHYGA